MLGSHKSLYFCSILLQMAAQIGVIICYQISVNFDNPDGSTSSVHINYDILVNIDYLDGSIGLGQKIKMFS